MSRGQEFGCKNLGLNTCLNFKKSKTFYTCPRYLIHGEGPIRPGLEGFVRAIVKTSFYALTGVFYQILPSIGV